MIAYANAASQKNKKHVSRTRTWWPGHHYKVHLPNKERKRSTRHRRLNDSDKMLRGMLKPTISSIRQNRKIHDNMTWTSPQHPQHADRENHRNMRWTPHNITWHQSNIHHDNRTLPESQDHRSNTIWDVARRLGHHEEAPPQRQQSHFMTVAPMEHHRASIRGWPRHQDTEVTAKSQPDPNDPAGSGIHLARGSRNESKVLWILLLVHKIS